MTKDELRQEIERLKLEVKRLEALVATLSTGRVNMIRIGEQQYSPESTELTMRAYPHKCDV